MRRANRVTGRNASPSTSATMNTEPELSLPEVTTPRSPTTAAYAPITSRTSAPATSAFFTTTSRSYRWYWSTAIATETGNAMNASPLTIVSMRLSSSPIAPAIVERRKEADEERERERDPLDLLPFDARRAAGTAAPTMRRCRRAGR